MFLAPRHLERIGRVEAELESSLGIRPARWSAGPSARSGSDCILIDEHGILGRIYGLGDVAFVGGTLVPVGGHNVLEPAQHGVPVLVGPEHGSFAKAVSLMVEAGVAAVCRDWRELAEALGEFAGSPPDREWVRSVVRGMTGEPMRAVVDLLERAGAIDREDAP